MERNNGQSPRLRIAGYVSGHAEPLDGAEPTPALEPGPAPRPLPATLPNISDYWPDRSHRPAPAAPPQPGEPRRHRRPVITVGLLAGLVITATLLITKPGTQPGQQELVAPVTAAPLSGEPAVTPVSAGPDSTGPDSTAPVSVAPSRERTPAPARPPATPSASVGTPRISAARLKLVSSVTLLDVRTADLGGDNFRVTTPADSGLDVDADFQDGTLSVSARPDGRKDGSGRVDVLLSEDIVWRLRMAAGVQNATFVMGTGTVSGIDLIGGARTIDIGVGRLESTLPILMAGGVRTWRIRTSEVVPVELALDTGAGDVTLYGDDRGGVSRGVTVSAGDPDAQPGLNIDAEGGIGSLDVARD